LQPSDAAGSAELPTTSPVRDDGARFRRGILIHALLARLPDVAAELREGTALAYLARQGLNTDDAKALFDEASAILSHADFAPLFAAGSRAEIGVVASLPELGGARVNGQIDRLAVTEDAVLIADFKTNRPPPATAEETPALYLVQMALYRAALSRIYPGKHIDCALIWTDGARLMPLPAELLNAEMAKIAVRNSA